MVVAPLAVMIRQAPSRSRPAFRCCGCRPVERGTGRGGSLLHTRYSTLPASTTPSGKGELEGGLDKAAKVSVAGRRHGSQLRHPPQGTWQAIANHGLRARAPRERHRIRDGPRPDPLPRRQLEVTWPFTIPAGSDRLALGGRNRHRLGDGGPCRRLRRYLACSPASRPRPCARTTSDHPPDAAHRNSLLALIEIPRFPGVRVGSGCDGQ